MPIIVKEMKLMKILSMNETFMSEILFLNTNLITIVTASVLSKKIMMLVLVVAMLVQIVSLLVLCWSIMVERVS